MKPKLLVLELWGIGDLTFATPLLRAARERYEITIVGKAHAQPLLARTFPEVRFFAYDAPWSAYTDKYRLWEWDWRGLLTLLARLRHERFEVAVSVRPDPRDHFFLWLLGAQRRFGFPRRGSEFFLTERVVRTREKQHRVEDWWDIARALGLGDLAGEPPRLEHAAYRSPRVDALLAGITRPLLCLHPGARISVRRWPQEYFREVLARLRARYDFHLLLIPDTDGYGAALAPLADTVLPPLAVDELVDVLGRVELLLCNDSGPGHLAAACDRPAIPIFGPTDPDWFRPWGDRHHLVIRDICPWRPCFDYCKFAEPHCMTKLLPDAAWPEIRGHVEALLARGIVSPALRR